MLLTLDFTPKPQVPVGLKVSHITQSGDETTHWPAV
jgi:hypothetical protein